MGLKSKCVQIAVLTGISSAALLSINLAKRNQIKADSSMYQFDPYETCDNLYDMYPFQWNLYRVDLCDQLDQVIKNRNVDNIKTKLQEIGKDRFLNRNDDNKDLINLVEKSFLQAIQNNDKDIILSLIYYTDGLIKNKALILACSVGNLKMIDILVMNGADIHTNDDECFKIAEDLEEETIKLRLLRNDDLYKFLNSPDVKFWFR